MCLNIPKENLSSTKIEIKEENKDKRYYIGEILIYFTFPSSDPLIKTSFFKLSLLLFSSIFCLLETLSHSLLLLLLLHSLCVSKVDWVEVEEDVEDEEESKCEILDFIKCVGEQYNWEVCPVYLLMSWNTPVTQRYVFLAATVDKFPYFGWQVGSDSISCKGRTNRWVLSNELVKRYLPFWVYRIYDLKQ